MDDHLPSWITLSGFILPAVILILRENPRDMAAISFLLIIAALCMLGGLLFSALWMYLLPELIRPLISSLLVLVGALLGLILRSLWMQLAKPD
ncbi:hypothetical protein [Marinobacterium weihaiense]|uniref:Uncharacterized protein n=1 Tax=Marinobacterium weihaiense TaxID=2851016 RepID=A0ABS6M8V9_9GAMM|nr:hypothetical protein [Marinobacterium weihaiense]MBV0932728.1 hypothetical protein [Marinobacterium weihaiense]